LDVKHSTFCNDPVIAITSLESSTL